MVWRSLLGRERNETGFLGGPSNSCLVDVGLESVRESTTSSAMDESARLCNTCALSVMMREIASSAFNNCVSKIMVREQVRYLRRYLVVLIVVVWR